MVKRFCDFKNNYYFGTEENLICNDGFTPGALFTTLYFLTYELELTQHYYRLERFAKDKI